VPNIGVISTFPPTQCGIATYSHDLIGSLKSISPFLQFIKIELSPCSPHPSNKNYIIQSNETLQYVKASEYINTANIDIVDIQHEFKIFGKPDGENISVLLNSIQKPIITTLHTVSPNLNEQREKIFVEIIKRSNKLYVFSKEAKNHIIGKYKKNNSSIEIIPHGVPKIKFQKPHQIQLRKKFTSNIIFVSAGHMRSTKGYELAIKALHSLKKTNPDFHYLILGSNHPQNETSQLYRETLIKLIAKLNLTKQVTFVSNYLDSKDLIKYIQLADICLTPYTRKDQSSSGVLSLMMACGRPIVSTPFQFAKSYVSEFSGTLSNSFYYSDFKTI
jgi:glycosyltransferase involved in cell wall biosynthesis